MSGSAPGAWALPGGVALCAGAGAWLLSAGGSWHRRARLLCADGGPPAEETTRLSSRIAGPEVWWRSGRWRRPRWPAADGLRVVLCCLAGGAVAALWGGSPLPLLAAVLVAPLAVRRWRQRRRQRAADRLEEWVIELCRSVASEVRAGLPPRQALAAAGRGDRPGPGETWGPLGASGALVLAATRYGGDVPAALRSAAELPGGEGLRGMAACWRVAVDGGASLAAGLERVAQALRAERDEREELRAQLAGPRATVLVLAGLPLFGLLLGSAMGVRPLWELLHSTAGLACLVTGGLLEWAGVLWASAIARSAGGGGGP